MGHDTKDQAVNPFLAPDQDHGSPFAVTEESGTHGPTREDLLLRAAEIGPARMTWESIAYAPTDPILGEKMQPHVAERRARFRRVVKVALGVCVGFCVVGAISSAVSSRSSTSTSTASAAIRKAAPAMASVPIEKLEIAAHGKAPSHVTAAVRLAPRWGKRR